MSLISVGVSVQSLAVLHGLRVTPRPSQKKIRLIVVGSLLRHEVVSRMKGFWKIWMHGFTSPPPKHPLIEPIWLLVMGI